MNGLLGALPLAGLAMVVGLVPVAATAADSETRIAQMQESVARQAAATARLQRAARMRWEQRRRSSAAHARMPRTMYASTQVVQAHGELSCPVLPDADTDRIVHRQRAGKRDPQTFFRTFDPKSPSRKPGFNVFAASGAKASPSPSPSSVSSDASHTAGAAVWSSITTKSGRETGGQHVYLFPSASEPLRQGFVRVINHSAEGGEVRIDPVDDGGRKFDSLTLAIEAGATVHFNSGDLENGNAGKGLAGSTGSGQGDWRLEFTSGLDIEVLSYIRTQDGFLTAIHDVAPVAGETPRIVAEGEAVSRRIAIFNPGSNRNQVSRLRLVNPSDAMAEVTIRGTDDRGMSGAGEVTLSLEPGTAREITAAELESGANGLTGSLGDGTGKWRLEVESAQPVVAMSLLESPTDHLTNLSTVSPGPVDGKHAVPLFPAAGDASGRQGFLRVVNRSETDGQVHIAAFDESDWDYEPLTLSIGANEVAHVNSDDLEQGNAQKGLSGGTGAGEGDWRLELTSDLDIEVLAYVRTRDGFLTAMHDVAPSAGNRHRVAVFNPGSNRNQESLLRLVNPGVGAVDVRITGIDGNGAAGNGDVRLTIPAGRTRTLAASELEDGGDGLEGSLGDGAGKWQLNVTSDAPVVAMSLLRSPTGHLTNLSTAPGRSAAGNVVQKTAEDVFRESIAGPIVQLKCITCHVEGGASGSTRLVFVTDDNPDHEAMNLQAFRDFLDQEEGGADYILNKIQGALGHGGGIQVPAGSEEYANMERFLGLIGEDISSVGLKPETLFDGVRLESARSTLRRAAIVFAGRTPTPEEYASIETGGTATLRRAIRGLMTGPEFHEFVIRGSNDRLFTDREHWVIGDFDRFVDFTNKRFSLAEAADASGDDGELNEWDRAVQYGAMRAPLELIARVAERDLPYTEILTADYVMANPEAAEAYGDSVAFEDPADLYEFQPSEILSYYRDGGDYLAEDVPGIGQRVIDPGPLSTIYPHAGILNTKVFLQRYPTTPTNRNRARSRWTYYHFLGLDVEKSAPRTTDPAALSDTNNPTMHNAACTVCHSVLDPVGGTFQNYGDEGLYRDRWEGLDAIDGFYKHGAEDEYPWAAGRDSFEVSARMRSDRQTISVAGWLGGGKERIWIQPWFDPPIDEDASPGEDGLYWHMGIDHVAVRNADGRMVKRFEPQALARDARCGSEEIRVDDESGEEFYESWFCTQELFVDIPTEGFHEVEVLLWEAHHGARTTDEARRHVTLSIGGYQYGDTWYRDMRKAGFDGKIAPNADNSLQWLAEEITADQRFAEATVKFWWPAIMGREVTEPPADDGDANFAGRLLASNAQTAELTRLARGFRRGFSGGSPYNLKDLLVEIVLSRWFRAKTLSDDDAVRTVALQEVGARRLLTPEELARKTLALTGFQWGRHRIGSQSWRFPHERRWSSLTDTGSGYGLLYGGIDSAGVTKRATDLTSVMAGVAQSHAIESSCPIVMKELYLLPEAERQLFAGVDTSLAPTYEAGKTFELESEDWRNKESLTLRGRLAEGERMVSISFLNDFWDETEGDSNVRLDRLELRDSAGEMIETVELETLEPVGDGECNHPVGDHFALHCTGTLYVPIRVPADDEYVVEVVAWADQGGDELPRVEMVLHGDTERSVGATAIKGTLVDLYSKLLGIEVAVDSPDVIDAYDLFVEIWQRRRHSEDGRFFGWSEGVDCNWPSDQHYLDGILEDAFVYREDWGDEWGAREDWDWEHINAHFDTIDWSDSQAVAETWTVVLAYLLMDYRYLYL